MPLGYSVKLQGHNLNVKIVVINGREDGYIFMGIAFYFFICTFLSPLCIGSSNMKVEDKISTVNLTVIFGSSERIFT